MDLSTKHVVSDTREPEKEEAAVWQPQMIIVVCIGRLSSS